MNMLDQGKQLQCAPEARRRKEIFTMTVNNLFILTLDVAVLMRNLED